MPRPARTLAQHESELRRRIDALWLLMDSENATARELQGAASLVRSGCDAYANRLDCASIEERRAG